MSHLFDRILMAVNVSVFELAHDRLSDLQKVESGALEQWLLGACSPTNCGNGFQSSRRTEDWLQYSQDSQVTNGH